MYNIMIVDDETLTREYLKHNIPIINHQWQVTCEASDGQEALEELKRHKVDLIITDIKMPVMDGLELCRIVSERFPDQKVIILSGHDEFTLAKKAILYGVHEYLLKPIFKEDLESALIRVTAVIDKGRNQALINKTTATLSEDSKNHVTKNFLKAVISDSHAEIKVLYPLIFRLKVSLIESAGLIMILALDEEVMMDKSIPLSDIPVFKYILHQVAAEIVEDAAMGKVFYDGAENTIVLVTGDDEAEIMERCKEIHMNVSEVLRTNTAITVTGGTGTIVSDVLQLNSSYLKAKQMLLSRLIYGGNAFFGFDDNKQAIKFVDELDKVITAIISGLLDNNERVYLVNVKNYVELFDSFTVKTIFRYGIYLIQHIAALNREFTRVGMVSGSTTGITNVTKARAGLGIGAGTGANAAWHLLEGFGLSIKTEPAKDDIIAIFNEILKSFAKTAMPELESYNEHEIVTKAKQYIYAHFAEPVSLALIAETIGVSSGYLSHIFHQSVNESYIKFLTRVRMEEAAKLLKSRPAPKVFDVAEKVGYISVKHFTYVFKQYFNMPPGEYQDKS